MKATPGDIILFSHVDGFHLAQLKTLRPVIPCICLIRLRKPQLHKGKAYRFGIFEGEADDKGKLLRVRKRLALASTETEGREEDNKIRAEYKAKYEAEVALTRKTPPTEDDRRIEQAQVKVLARRYPVTVRLWREIEARMRLAEKSPLGQSPQTAALDRLKDQIMAAYRVEMKKAIGAKNLGVSLDPGLLEVIADAIQRHGKDEDRVDYELAANWKDKGYNNMSTEQYARAVAAVVGKTFTRRFCGLVKQRRQRLGLKTLRRRGPADSLGQF